MDDGGISELKTGVTHMNSHIALDPLSIIINKIRIKTLYLYKVTFDYQGSIKENKLGGGWLI